MIGKLLFSVLVIGVAASANGSRMKNYSLSECIKEAGIILVGVVESRDDVGDLGVLRVPIQGGNVLKGAFAAGDMRIDERLKGTAGEKYILIAQRSFHSKSDRTLEGPIEVKQQEGYIFFLKKRPNEKGHFELFDGSDGVIQYNNPVRLEIEKRVKQESTKTQHTSAGNSSTRANAGVGTPEK